MLTNKLYALPFTIRKRLVARLIRLRARTPSEMATFAHEHTRLYRELYGDAGLDPRAAAFEDLPILEKRRVHQSSPYDLLADTHRDAVTLYGETTGSTGSPTPAFYTPEEFGAVRLLGLASTQLDALRVDLAASEHRCCVNGMAFGFTIAGMSFGELLDAAGGLVANVGSRSTLATPPRIARAIARLEPVAIAATPIDLLSWMRIVEEDHPDRYEAVVDGLKALISSAELCARSRSRRIAEHFSLRHADAYACVEGFFNLPCTCGEKHMLPAYHVELFDTELRPASNPGTGRVAFTNLVKRSTPMVRYLLDDWVTISKSACPHGFGWSVVPHGRYELNVDLGGEAVNVEPIEELVFTHGLFGDYRAVVFDDRVELEIEEYAPGHDPAGVIEDHFEERFGLPARARFVPFGAITAYREPRGRKPILKVTDRRSTSTQETPEFL